MLTLLLHALQLQATPVYYRSVDRPVAWGGSPESAILCCGPSWDDLGDEDAWVISDVGVVCAASDAEA